MSTARGSSEQVTRCAGRVVAVTGAAGGIGAAIVRRLATDGWSLVLADRDPRALAELADEVVALGGDCLPRAGDVTQPEYVAGLVGSALERYRRLDGFVSNAGIVGGMVPLDDYPEAVFDEVMAVNVRGTFLCLKHALPALRVQPGASFVAMASTSAVRGRANLSAYVASKHAVLGLVRAAALECVGSHARVNAILPGPTQTAMIDAIDRMAAQRSPDGHVARAVSTPYGRPEDVAAAVRFVLSPDAAHMNGAMLTVDGGSIVA
ncbi:SDR family NAD(P)-dependent oxidoreductase [Chitinasiproducens palmae]|uniref:NAD(P)-dependent dehydrogenase, short-chain alcohol dehydrogenase family n=1 Tax=Chitinasiproducens palmae TaxID=1770053 RepID=A0A1H2PLK6_9BURK|nr:SDR family oxidoreductase [Chitinasiproducens palmae]SDV47333.1 NAD(P)-dependent dehydrogenase, short-chain alcohol dehydrogenase family [Chitinasiproducens palmae]